MLRQLSHFRDFINDEIKKWMPTNLHVGTYMLLTDYKNLPIPEEDAAKGVNVPNHKTVHHVFDSGGTYIGTIENPDWIPKA